MPSTRTASLARRARPHRRLDDVVVLRPHEREVQGDAGRGDQRPPELLHQLGVERRSPTDLRRERRCRSAGTGRPDRSRARPLRHRFVEGTRARSGARPPCRPGPVAAPRRRGSRCPRRWWCVDLRRSPSRDGRSMPPWRPSWSSMWSKNGSPVRQSVSPPRRRRADRDRRLLGGALGLGGAGGVAHGVKDRARRGTRTSNRSDRPGAGPVRSPPVRTPVRQPGTRRPPRQLSDEAALGGRIGRQHQHAAVDQLLPDLGTVGGRGAGRMKFAALGHMSTSGSSRRRPRAGPLLDQGPPVAACRRRVVGPAPRPAGQGVEVVRQGRPSRRSATTRTGRQVSQAGQAADQVLENVRVTTTGRSSDDRLSADHGRTGRAPRRRPAARRSPRPPPSTAHRLSARPGPVGLLGEHGNARIVGRRSRPRRRASSTSRVKSASRAAGRRRTRTPGRCGSAGRRSARRVATVRGTPVGQADRLEHLVGARWPRTRWWRRSVPGSRHLDLGDARSQSDRGTVRVAVPPDPDRPAAARRRTPPAALRRLCWC